MAEAQQSKAPAGLVHLSLWAGQYAWRRRRCLLMAAGSLLLKAGFDLLKPWPLVLVIDYVLRHKPMSPGLARAVSLLPGAGTPTALLGWAAGLTVLFFLLSWVAALANTYASTTLGQRMIYDLGADLYARLQQLSLHFHLRRSVGDMVRRITIDCTAVSVIVKDALLPVLGALVSLAAMLAILWRIDATLTLLTIAVVPYFMLVLHRYARPMMARGYEQQEVESSIYSRVEQTFAAIPVVQAFGRESLHEQHLHEAARETVAATVRLTQVQLRFKILIGLGTALGTALLFGVGAWHAWRGTLSIGAIVLFLSYLAAFYEPMVAVMYSTALIEGAAGSAWRVWEMLHAAPQVAERAGAVALGPVRGLVQFENVTFGYEPGRPVLRHISFSVQPGEQIALVGATGAGKTTLVSLLPRFFDPWEGRVLMDGHDLREVSLRSLRQQVAMVLQEPFLFPLSVAENIAYGRPGAKFSEIQAAARAARAEGFIQRLPRGYATVLAAQGLSVGERQRISIARALLKDAPVLILDEPAAALDVQTERELLAALEHLTRNRTTFIIAHRLSTIATADRILVLEEGRMTEFGTHAELLERGQTYARLYALQHGVVDRET